jgi:hypothetical protein
MLQIVGGTGGREGGWRIVIPMPEAAAGNKYIKIRFGLLYVSTCSVLLKCTIQNIH